MLTPLKKILPHLLVASSVVIALAPTLVGATAPKFAAKQMLATPAVTTLDQLQMYSYTIGFKNTGTATWSRTGSNAITIKTTDSVKYEDWFASDSWIDKTTVATMNAAQAKTGEVVFFTLVLQAPAKAMTYTNHFAVFTGTTKIANTDFKLPITVTAKTAAKSKQVPPPATPVSAKASGSVTTAATPPELQTNPLVKAQLMLRSTDSLNLQSGNTGDIKIAFKDNGQRNWRNVAPSLVTLQFDPSSTNGASFQDSSWVDATTVTKLQVPLIQVGELAFFSFKIKAPAIAGNYKPQFRLVMNGDTLVQGSDFAFLATVTAPPPPPPPPTPVLAVNPAAPTGTIVCAAAVDDTSTTNTTTPVAPDSAQNPSGQNVTGTCNPPHQEPTMRVGLDNVQGQLGVTSAAPYNVVDSTGVVVMTVPANTTTFLAYDVTSKQYTVIGPGPILTSSQPYHVHAATEPSIITLVTYSNPTAFDASLNDNVFRGSIEIHWSDNDGKLWIVNELGMEDYLRGLAESGNSAPMEYLKALVVAARTYALWEHDTKSKSTYQPFDVYASVQDQAYRGYNDEQRIPNISAAADATRGQVVTYQGQVVITPYSASTNGHSRSWSEAWGGTDKPWLIDQPIPEDVGRVRYGHGVGMSQLAAEDMASKEGKGYVQILNFFYVGTQVSQWY